MKQRFNVQGHSGSSNLSYINQKCYRYYARILVDKWYTENPRKKSSEYHLQGTTPLLTSKSTLREHLTLTLSLKSCKLRRPYQE